MTPTDEEGVLSGEQLREIRTLAGMGQRELGNLIGYDKSTISKLERGVMAMTPELQLNLLNQMLPILRDIRNTIAKYIRHN